MNMEGITLIENEYYYRNVSTGIFRAGIFDNRTRNYTVISKRKEAIIRWLCI